jgi:Ca2+-binding RTX toxin-like protein
MGALACALAVLGVVPAGAQAAKVSVTLSSGPDPTEYISYSASRGETNALSVKRSHSRYTFSDRGAKTMRARHGCRARGRHKAVCASKAVQNVTVSLRDGNDSARFSGFGGSGAPTAAPTEATQVADLRPDVTGGEFPEAVDVDGGAGNDTIRTTNRSDFVLPGPGADHVKTMGGDDEVITHTGEGPDTIDGGPGMDNMNYVGSQPVSVDVPAGTGTVGGQTDHLAGFERFFGGDGADSLKGGDGADGLYGGGGADTVDGAGGNDYLQAGAAAAPAPDKLNGGPGDDILDGRALTGGSAGAQTQQLSCGDGNDRAFGTPQSQLDATCEQTIYLPQLPSDNQIPFTPTFPVRPVGTSGGNPQLLIACPPAPPQVPDASLFACSGQIDVEAPAAAGSTSPPPSYGAASYSIPAGGQQTVTVPLNAAGQAALAGHAMLGVHLRSAAALSPGSGSGPYVDFGWQAQLG